MESDKDDAVFEDAVIGLERGDFSRLDSLFAGEAGKCRIVAWCEAGRFKDHPKALSEAFSCACFNGRTEVAQYLLDHGVDPTAGAGTGMTAFHWAANRGQLNTVRFLIAKRVPMEVKNIYGGTVLGCAAWSAVHEPKADHPVIIQALIAAGADVGQVEFPTGDARVDEVLRRARG